MELANTFCTILRGTTTTPLGDVIDSSTPFLEHVPAVLVEADAGPVDLDPAHDPAGHLHAAGLGADFEHRPDPR